MERDKTKLVEALRKDYKQLYVKEYTTGWREQRLMRNTELEIMSLKNTEEYIEKELDKAREDVLIELQKEFSEYGVPDDVRYTYPLFYINNIIEEKLSKLKDNK